MKRIFLTTLLISLAGLLNLTAQERIYTPSLSLPANGAVDQMPNVVLDWNAVTGGNTGIIKYDVQLDTDPALSSPETFETEFLTAVETEPLAFGETYYWRVRAKDGNSVSDWSDIWSFRVVRRVVLSSPADASLQNDTVRIQWGAMTGIQEYDYQFDTVYFWKALATGQTKNLTAVSAVDETHAWFVGAGGFVLFYDGTTWTEQESSLSTDLYSVHFVDANNGWAVGKGGKIIYYDGSAWSEQSSGTSNDLFGVYMLSPTSGWAVGKAGSVLYYNGTAWSSQYTATKDLNKVFAYDQNNVWAVGKSGLIIYYNGSSWNVQETGGTIKEFLCVAFSSPTQGWALGKTGFIMKYDGGAWSIYDHTLTTKDLTGVFFTSPENAYAVGKTGTLLQYDGIDWSSQSSTTATNLNDVSFGGTAGYLAGDAGTVIMYNNEAFTSPLATIKHVPVGTTFKKEIDLLFGTQYYWRMRAKSIQGYSEWSGARSFNTRATVALDKPDNGKIDQMLNQELSWKNQMSELVSYEIQVDDDPAYGSPVFMATTAVKVPAELLKFGVEYNWRVRALHALDISDWSESRTFTTINTVVLESPANNETDVKISPLLTWDAQTGIGGYQAQVSTSNSFSNVLVNEMIPVVESSLIVPMVLDKDAVFYWRVRAYNGLDTSGWSDTWSFRTMPPVGIDEPGLEGKISIYPNPAVDFVYIQVKDQKSQTLHLRITDLVGKLVSEKDILVDAGNLTFPLEVSILQNGIYILRISDNESSFTKKLVIKR
jgi:photosystem II stability/assembly factor-like uncharacterized protein